MARGISKEELRIMLKKYKDISLDKMEILNTGTDLHVLLEEDITYICNSETNIYAAQRRLHQRIMDY